MIEIAKISLILANWRNQHPPMCAHTTLDSITYVRYKTHLYIHTLYMYSTYVRIVSKC